MRFDVVGLTCRMKSVLITAMFNIGTGGAIPVVAPKGTGGGFFKVATPYHVILCNFRSLFHFIYISVNSWYLNKPDGDWYWPVEISQLNSISRCLISPCKSLINCNVFMMMMISIIITFQFICLPDWNKQLLVRA